MYGCCVDRVQYEKKGHGPKGCVPETCMVLPEGATCGDCVHIARCKTIFGHIETDAACDWFPRMFLRAGNGEKGATCR